MSNITAKMVAELREMTGLGMMECKKALVEAIGDIKKAEEILRIKSGARAGKMSGRTAAEGIVTSFSTPDHKRCALVEINCETDFVAKDESFINFANSVARVIVENNISQLDDLNITKLESGKTVEEAREELIARLGENISVRRHVSLVTDGLIATYLHGKKIGVICEVLGGDSELGRDLAMHIAASKPICVSRNNVAATKIEEERNIYTQQASQSGKPAEIVAKMVEGRLNKFLAEVTLLGQPFVKNPDITVEKLLEGKGAQVKTFAMFVVGEGIEKKTVDYAAEVAAAAKV